jgi:hypothetical protein
MLSSPTTWATRARIIAKRRNSVQPLSRTSSIVRESQEEALGLIAGWAGLSSVFLASTLIVLCATAIAVRLLVAASPGTEQL